VSRVLAVARMLEAIAGLSHEDQEAAVREVARCVRALSPVRAMSKACPDVSEARKSKDRARKAAERERKRLGQPLDNPRTGSDVDKGEDLPLSLFSESDPESESSPSLSSSLGDVADTPRAKSVRGTRLSDTWTPDAELVAWTREQGADPDRILASFRDYWRAQPGQRGVKADWPATWRNWVRRDRMGPAATAWAPRGGGTGTPTPIVKAKLPPVLAPEELATPEQIRQLTADFLGKGAR